MPRIFLGCDSVLSDEIVNGYYRDGDRLIEQCSYDRRERDVDPSATVAELNRMADISREMVEHGGDYPARELTCRATADAIKRSFNL